MTKGATYYKNDHDQQSIDSASFFWFEFYKNGGGGVSKICTQDTRVGA